MVFVLHFSFDNILFYYSILALVKNFYTNNLIHVSLVVLSIGGHAKTLMLVHINPELNAIGETISTLKFAERVASIELGAAQSNKETGEIRELKEEVRVLTHIKSAILTIRL